MTHLSLAQKNSVMKDVAGCLEDLAESLVACSIDFYSDSMEVRYLKELAKKLRDAIDV